MGLNHTPESKVMPFEFIKSFCCSISCVSIYHGPQWYTRVKSYDVWISFVFNFEHLDVLCAWIGHSGEKLWPFEFHESFYCSILNVSIHHGLQSYTRVKSYTIWICQELLLFNFLRLDILCVWIEHPSQKLCHLNLPRTSVFNFERLEIIYAWIGHPSEKLWPFEFYESFYCSISNVSINHGPQSYTQVKSYGI